MEFPGSKTTEVPKSDGRSEIERMLLGCHRMCEELSVYGIELLFGDAVVPRPQRTVRGSQESGEPLEAAQRTGVVYGSQNLFDDVSAGAVIRGRGQSKPMAAMNGQCRPVVG